MEFLALGVFVVVALVVAWLVLGVAGMGKSKQTGRTKAQELRHSNATLHYEVPPGQDPAVLVAALSKAGFEAEDELVEGRNRLLIGRADGEAPVRSSVRDVIEGANQTTMGGGPIQHRVVFEDEV